MTYFSSVQDERGLFVTIYEAPYCGLTFFENGATRKERKDEPEANRETLARTLKHASGYMRIYV